MIPVVLDPHMLQTFTVHSALMELIYIVAYAFLSLL